MRFTVNPTRKAAPWPIFGYAMSVDLFADAASLHLLEKYGQMSRKHIHQMTP